MDSIKRSCPCPYNYYTKSLSPFVCELYQQFNADGEDVSTAPDACVLDLNNQINLIEIECDSGLNTSASTQLNKIFNTITANFDHVSIDPACEAELVLSIWYKDPFNPVETYIVLNPIYYTIVVNVVYILIPLIDLDTVFGAGPLTA